MNDFQAGPITERITLLGRHESCVYWIEDQGQAVLMGGGMTYIIPDLLHQIETLRLHEQRIRQIWILHAHFDHCGIVPFLKKRWPWVQVVGSARAKELLDKPLIAQSVSDMNQKALAATGLSQTAGELGLPFEALPIDRSVTDGDVLRCGSLDLAVIGAPGHSSCSMAVYVPAEKALFASDAVGMRLKGVYQPTPNANYDQYQQTLAKLATYDVELLLLEHFGAYKGDDARAFIPKAMEAAARTRQLLEDTYRRTRDVEKCTQEVTALFLKRETDSFLSADVRALVAGQMVRFIAKKIDAETK